MKPVGLIVFIGVLYALALFLAVTYGDLPAGMHRANIVTEDTIIRWDRTPSSAWLDSVMREDSIKVERAKK